MAITLDPFDLGALWQNVSRMPMALRSKLADTTNVFFAMLEKFFFFINETKYRL